MIPDDEADPDAQRRILRDIFAGLDSLLPEMKSKVDAQADSFLNYCIRLKEAHRRAAPVRGTRRALKELAVLADLLDRLGKHADNLSLDARQALAPGPSICELVDQLEVYTRSVQKAQGCLKKESPIGSPKGKRNTYERQVAAKAIATYATLTGKKRGRSVSSNSNKPTGPLLKFVTGTFAALNIRASAANMIRQATCSRPPKR